jgi:N-methylhydantoinase B
MISSSLGGAGARSFGDGHDNSGPLMAPCYSAINVEHAESLYPMLFLYRKRAADSGGPGKWRGGVSADHAITPHGTDEIEIGVTSSGADHSHTLGLVGGYPGAGSTVRIARAGMPGDEQRSVPTNWHEIGGDKEVLAPKGRLTLKKGDVFSTIPHGGGGFGDPLDRNPELVLRDVIERVVSVDGARDYYAVVVAGEPLHVDHEATIKLRTAVRRGRIGNADDAARAKPANGGADAHSHGSGIVQKNGHWACSACENALGPVANNAKEACAHQYRPLAAAGPLIAPRSGGESRKFRLSEYSCPNCGTLLAVDQTLKTAQTHWHDVRPA